MGWVILAIIVGLVIGLLAIALLVWEALRLANISVALPVGPAMVSAFLYVGGAMAAPWYLIYLWVTFGNGFRYGTRFLEVSAVLGTPDVDPLADLREALAPVREASNPASKKRARKTDPNPATPTDTYLGALL